MDENLSENIQEQELRLKLNNIEERLAELRARWPYHSVQPKMVAEQEDLEEERNLIISILKKG